LLLRGDNFALQILVGDGGAHHRSSEFGNIGANPLLTTRPGRRNLSDQVDANIEAAVRINVATMLNTRSKEKTGRNTTSRPAPVHRYFIDG
jgi:hypothetical protein